jgi:hypothetical protein
MKVYGTIYLKVYLVMHLIFILLSLIVLRIADITYPFIRLEIGAILISGVVSLAIFMFRLEKGHTVINTVLGYLILIPSIFMLRNTFGQYLFRFTWLLYVLMVFIGIIYGTAVWIVSKKYQKEVKELNDLLEKQKIDDET